jgi:hypothetical protein
MAGHNLFRKALVAFMSTVIGYSTIASPAIAYVHNGNCHDNATGHEYSWDIVQTYRTSIDGASERLYAVPGQSLWQTCIPAGGVGFGHMVMLLSVQKDGGAGGIVQIGLGKFVSSDGGSGWMFMATPADDWTGTVVIANSWFGESPVAGRSYYFEILANFDPVESAWYWELTIKDLSNGHIATHEIPSVYFHSSNDQWYGGETANWNDTMGHYGDFNDFATYRLRTDSGGAWGSYYSQSLINSSCRQTGPNQSIDECSPRTIGSDGGFYVWNQ